MKTLLLILLLASVANAQFTAPLPDTVKKPLIMTGEIKRAVANGINRLEVTERRADSLIKILEKERTKYAALDLQTRVANEKLLAELRAVQKQDSFHREMVKDLTPSFLEKNMNVIIFIVGLVVGGYLKSKGVF